MKGGRNMDVIQKAVVLFDELVQRVKDIANMLTYSYMPVASEAKSSDGLFWIFNW